MFTRGPGPEGWKGGGYGSPKRLGFPFFWGTHVGYVQKFRGYYKNAVPKNGDFFLKELNFEVFGTVGLRSMFGLLPIRMIILFSLFSVGFFRFFSHRHFYWLCIVQQDNFNLNFWWKVVIHTIFVQKNCRRKVKPQGGPLPFISTVPITPFIGVITPATYLFSSHL